MRPRRSTPCTSRSPSVVLTAGRGQAGERAGGVGPNARTISQIFSELGDKAAVDAAFAAAYHVTRQRFVITRIMHNAIEPARHCIGEYDQRHGHFTPNGCIARSHSVRRAFAEDIFQDPGKSVSAW